MFSSSDSNDDATRQDGLTDLYPVHEVLNGLQPRTDAVEALSIESSVLDRLDALVHNDRDLVRVARQPARERVVLERDAEDQVLTRADVEVVAARSKTEYKVSAHRLTRVVTSAAFLGTHYLTGLSGFSLLPPMAMMLALTSLLRSIFSTASSDRLPIWNVNIEVAWRPIANFASAAWMVSTSSCTKSDAD